MRQYMKSLVKWIRNHMPRRGLFLSGLMILTILTIVSIYGNKLGRYSSPLKHQTPIGIKRESTFRDEEKRSKTGSMQAMSSKVYTKRNTTLQKMRRLPGAIIFGTRKGGTRALGEYLNMHPNIEICFEPYFFNINSNYKRSFEYYRSLMPYSLPHQMTIEKTPSYWVSERAAERIRKFNKTIKLIVTLRHPVKRMISDYWHTRRGEDRNKHHRTIKKLSFEELAIDQATGEVNRSYTPVKVSMYYKHFTHWLKYFPIEQIHIVDGDNLIVNPIEEIEKVETFLGLEHMVTKDKLYFDSTKGFYCMIKSKERVCMQKSKGHAHPAIDPAVYRQLTAFFEPHNEQLFSLLGRRFSSWN